MKKVKRVKKSTDLGYNFVAFGNKKSVFWSITIATIILSLVSIPIIILYKDLAKIPYDHTDPNIKKKWHVIVKHGDGDDAAMRKDVKTTLLLIHRF